MLYLIWNLINIAAYIYFIFISVKASKFIREHLGLFATLIFWIGILSFITKPKNNNSEQNTDILLPKNVTAANKNILVFNTTEIKLENDRFSEFTLEIDYSRDKETNGIEPVHAYSKAYMFPNGENWKPKAAYLGITGKADEFSYFVTGTIEWRLLGITFYTTPRTFKGSEVIK